MFKIGDRVRLRGKHAREYDAGTAIVTGIEPMFLKWEGKGYGSHDLPYPEEYFELVLYLIELVQTCSACPEQYDAFENGRQVGYLRLRHGYFYVECPGINRGVVKSETVYEAEIGPRGMDVGCFNEEERQEHLPKAIEAIERWLGRGKMPEPLFTLEEITNA
jgi:hypothetical protein